SGTLTFDAGLYNPGTVEIHNAMLVCNAGFTNNGVVHLQSAATNRIAAGGVANGTFDALAGTVVDWTSGTFTLNPSAQLNGGGLYRINSTTLARSSDLTVSNLDLISGTLNVTGMVTVAKAMNWTAG